MPGAPSFAFFAKGGIPQSQTTHLQFRTKSEDGPGILLNSYLDPAPRLSFRQSEATRDLRLLLILEFREDPKLRLLPVSRPCGSKLNSASKGLGTE